MITKETRLVGGMGTRYVSGTTEVTGLQHFMVSVDTDATITSITGINDDGDTVDVLAQMGLTVSVTIKEGRDLYVNLNTTITAIKLATGTVYLY